MTNNRPTTQQKKAVAQRARNCYEYCRSPARFAVQPFSVEHIFPQALEGPTSLDNLALACQGCNNHKYNKISGYDPVNEAYPVPLHNPRQQIWSDHFAWSADFTLIIGLTNIGRATIETLHLNRESVVNLRRILYAVGEHPPSEEASDE